MITISTHVLDTARGRPAAGVPLRLEAQSRADWKTLAEAKTNADGRAPELLASGTKLARGVYRLTFDTRAYFSSLGAKSFYPTVSVVFEIAEDAHHHVPLLLSPFGYSTYRGS